MNKMQLSFSWIRGNQFKCYVEFLDNERYQQRYTTGVCKIVDAHIEFLASDNYVGGLVFGYIQACTGDYWQELFHIFQKLSSIKKTDKKVNITYQYGQKNYT